MTATETTSRAVAPRQAATQAPATLPTIGPEERALLIGDLSQLTPDQRATLVTSVCASLGLNPLTQPFAYIVLNSKLTLYARKDCTDQLRTLHGISLRVSRPEVIEDILYVTANASTPAGRVDEDYGAVYVGGLKGEARANALLKCMPLDTEILTREGWKLHDCLTIGEEVLGYDAERDETAWTRVEAITVHDALPMGVLRTANGRVQVRCTAGHRWAVEKPAYRADRRGDGTRGARVPYRNRGAARAIIPVEDVVSVAGRRLIVAAPEAGTVASILSPVEAAVLGWAVTDGTIKRVGNSVRIGVSQSKERNFSEIRALVGAMAPGAKEFVGQPVRRTFPSSGQTSETLPQHWWYIPAAVSRAILDKAGYHDRSDLPRIVTRLSAHARQAMRQAMMLAEGDARGTFANTDRSILDAFQILCTLDGIALGVERHLTPYDGYKPLIHQRALTRRHISTHNLHFAVYGHAPAWCPTTGLGTWVMRQGGRVMITGNSITKAKRRVTLSICGLGMLDETEVETIPGALATIEPPTVGVAPSAALLSASAPASDPAATAKAARLAAYQELLALRPNTDARATLDYINAIADDVHMQRLVDGGGATPGYLRAMIDAVVAHGAPAPTSRGRTIDTTTGEILEGEVAPAVEAAPTRETGSLPYVALLNKLNAAATLEPAARNARVDELIGNARALLDKGQISEAEYAAVSARSEEISPVSGAVEEIPF